MTGIHSMFGDRRCRAALELVTALLLVHLFVPVRIQALSNGGDDLRVMNYNIYEGTNFVAISQATTFPQFLAAVGQTMMGVRATRPAERMQAVAAQIMAARPTIVSLEEVAQWATGPYDSRTQSCGALRVEFDMLKELQDTLAAQGGHYEVAVQIAQWAFPPVPGMWPTGGFFCAQLVEYNVILARTGLEGSSFTWSNPQSGLYVNRTYLHSPIGVLPLPRAWTSVDATFNDQAFRFIGTDFDAVDPHIRELQGGELRSGAADTPLPVVIAMDSNSQAAPLPRDPTFLHFLSAGYRDAWSQGSLGLTCCQAELLDNQLSELFTRVDLVLTSGAITAQGARLYGTSQADKTVHGLWPSDHAGIAAQLVFH